MSDVSDVFRLHWCFWKYCTQCWPFHSDLWVLKEMANIVFENPLFGCDLCLLSREISPSMSSPPIIFLHSESSGLHTSRLQPYHQSYQVSGVGWYTRHSNLEIKNNVKYMLELIGSLWNVVLLWYKYRGVNLLDIICTISNSIDSD